MVKSELVQALNKKMPDFQEMDVESALNCIVNQMVVSTLSLYDSHRSAVFTDPGI